MTSNALTGTFGPYRIMKKLRDGSGAAWYRASHDEHGTVRLKVLDIAAREDPAALQHHVLEAGATSAIDHPGILKVVDSGAVEGRYFLATENVPEQTLADLLNEEGRLGQRKAVTIARGVLEALEAAHQAKLQHRLLTPELIYLTNNHKPKLTGFQLTEEAGGLGLARDLKRAARLSAYAAPELMENLNTASETSDVYTVGALLYRMVTGEPVLAATTPKELAEQLGSALPFVPSSIQNTVAKELDLVILKALEVVSGDRFPSAHFMGRALEMVEQGEPTEIKLKGKVQYREWPWSLRLVLLVIFLQIAYLVIVDQSALVKIKLELMGLFR